MADIWKIGQDATAAEYFKEHSLVQIMLAGRLATAGNSLMGVSALTKACEQMINDFDAVLEDNNEYLIDVDNFNDEVQLSQEELRAKIEKLKAEITELEAKEKDGTITEEEKKELEAKRAEVNALCSNNNSELESKGEKLEDEGEEIVQQVRTKEVIATDYAETTIEKGEPFANTVVKRKTFFRKLFGITKRQKHKKEVGEKAVAVGGQLLDLVKSSQAVDEKIDTKKVKKEV